MSGHEHTGFAMIPMWMVCDEEITPAAIRVFLVLSGHVQRHGTWRLTHDEIATDSGYKRSSVIASLKLLRQLGVVEWETPDPKDPDAAFGCVYRIRVDRAGGYSPERTGGVQPAEQGVFSPVNTNIDSPKTPQRGAADADEPTSLLPANVVPMKTTPAKKRETPLPADWSPSPSHAAFASEHRLDLDIEAQQFRAHAEAHDRRAVVWNAAFTQWLLKADQMGRRVQTFSSSRPAVRRDGNGRIREW